jgi:copper transport protein
MLLANPTGFVLDNPTGAILDALMVAVRITGATALLVLIGGTVFLGVMRWPNDRTRHGRWLDGRAHRYLWGAWLAAFGAAFVGVLLWGPWAHGLGFSEMLRLETLEATAKSRYGIAAGLRVLFLLIVAPLLWAGWPWPGGRRRTASHRRPGWLIAAALLLTAPLSGHAGAGSDPVFGVAIGWLHISSAAVWLGGLILLMVCVLPRVQIRLGDYVPQFSAMATVSMLVAVITGTVQSWRQLGSLDALTTTTYGWMLLAKLAAFGLLMLIALGSHELTKRAALDPSTLPRRRGPGAALAESDAGRAKLLRRLVLGEVVVAAFVIIATELMANATPAYVEARSRPQPAVVRTPATTTGQVQRPPKQQPTTGAPEGDGTFGNLDQLLEQDASGEPGDG